MGRLGAAPATLGARVLAAVASLLDDAEREAVLGDLAEARHGDWYSVRAVSGLVARQAVLRVRRGEALLPAMSAAVLPKTEPAETWPEWLLPLATGLIAATCVIAAVVPPRAHTLSWSSVVSRSALLLSLAAAVAVGAVFALHRAYRDYFRRPGGALLACAWSSAIWIPLLLLVWSEHAIWMVLTPVPIAGLVASFARRKHDALLLPPEWPVANPVRPMFDGGKAPGRAPFARLALLTALLLDLCVLTAAAQELPLTCSLIILITSCLAWGFTPSRVPHRAESATPVRARISVLPCFLLTCLALTPFLRLGLGNSHLNSVVLAKMMQGAPRLAAVPTHVYSGVILMAPPLPKRKLLMSPPKALLGGVMHLSRPMTIPFDGAYWYFQEPDTRPKPDARVQRGDPKKGHIHSTDWTPLQMEAHQRLGTRLHADCCRSLSVSLVNADIRTGLIQVEARLRDVTSKRPETVSLGIVPIRSTAAKHISTSRPEVQETIAFPIQGRAANLAFNEITLIFHMAAERNLAGARIQVNSFTLQP